MGITRFKVARLLDIADEAGLVRTVVADLCLVTLAQTRQLAGATAAVS